MWNKIFMYSAVICWMLIIFSFSAQDSNTSKGTSGGITEIISSYIEKILPAEAVTGMNNKGLIENYIRKAAHFIIYFILGFLVANAVGISGKSQHIILVSLIICLLYAMTDEVHQFFVPGRAMRLKDVILDLSGASLGVEILVILRGYTKKLL